MRKCKWAAITAAVIMIPQLAAAQGFPEQIRGLHKVIEDLYNEILPECSNLIGVGQALAGFAATFYIGSRVWKSIASAEPIDFYPLFRPFVLGFCIMIFPQVIGLMNGILKPTVIGTDKMVQTSNDAIKELLARREKEMKDTRSYKMYGVLGGYGDRDLWMLYTHPDEKGNEGVFGKFGNDVEFMMSRTYYNMKNWFKNLISFLLQLLYEAAALCINTLRTFNLLILALLGPFVFGLAVFDGFQHTLTVWLAKYVNFYLWLPVANILGTLLGKIQQGMIKLDLSQMNQYGDTFFTTSDVGYIVFMIIGIVSYFTVPSIAQMVVNTGTGSAITSKITSMATSTVGMGVGMATGGVGMVATGAGMAADAFGDANLMMTKGFGGAGNSSGYFKDKLSGDK